ncbi:PREDICTED: uncharacterized protein LOC108617652 [Drosophila arizonae]|uniref:Uncharacterized protein LOC108617652 n=1 Tax=Drosophila arizonae TaxID=7263 RepID=A0ABM1PP50_DROAR|nr:PREDICTED: uncharacterized protein LOC108617652 [Drosophila arizonae]
MFSTLFFPGQAFSDDRFKACQCWRPDVTKCTTVNVEKKGDYFEDDIEDIANSLIKVMILCRLPAWQARRTKEPIKRSFRHYEEFRYRVDRVPHKRFGKENFLHDLVTEAGMNRMDSQLAYGITKRAFRAYYHGTGEGGKQLKSLESQLRHRSECIWLHASKRTAEIFAVYAGLMYWEQKQYEECIECIYKTLYDELQTRIIYEDPEGRGCTCLPAVSQASMAPKTAYKYWDTISVNTIASMKSVKTTELFFNKEVNSVSKLTSPISLHMEYTMISMEHMISKLEQASKGFTSSKTSDKSQPNRRPRKKKRKDTKCACHKLQCLQDRQAPVITAESSQGPYICRWIPYKEEDEELPHHHVPCPVSVCPPCESELSCDDECICTCQICTCPPAYGDDMEEAHGEKLSKSGLEDYDTDYCYLAPFRDGPRVEKEEASVEEEEEEDPNACVCMCEYKRRGWPHLFTYLAPFKDVKPTPEPEPPVEPEKPRIPPPGISLDAYRCWNDPVEPKSMPTSQPNSPYITLLSASKQPPFNIEVTVKTQHYPKATGKPPTGAARSSITIKRNTVALENLNADMKAVPNVKPQQQAGKAAGPVRQPAKPQPNSVPPKAPAPAAPTATAPANAEDEKLTEEDILAMFGLNK